MVKKGNKAASHQKVSSLVTAAQMQNGPLIDPISRLFLYSSDEWEGFVDEWVSECLKPKYKSTQRMTGANDRGIDIAAFVDDNLLLGVWDNFQCKHYGKPLMPGDAWPEIAKILWYSFNGDYVAPREYNFVAPKGVGTTLSLLLANVTKLKDGLVAVWDKNCAAEITNTETVALTGEFAAYVDEFDFSIFKAISVRSVIDAHRETKYFLTRFGGGLPARPQPTPPPEEIGAHESVYVAKLLDVYGDHTKETISDMAELKKWSALDQHFHRQREAFYHAEALRVFVRDKVEPGTYESLQDNIYGGVIDTRDDDHPDQFRRVVAVTDRAQILPLEAHALGASTFNKDKHGICHQLANDGRLKWEK